MFWVALPGLDVELLEPQPQTCSAGCHVPGADTWALCCHMLRPLPRSLTHPSLQVCDFNLSRVMEETVVLSSMAASNPRWLAPEILGGKGYSFSSDVYSFGMIMWEFLTWQVPWHDCGPWQVRLAFRPRKRCGMSLHST